MSPSTLHVAVIPGDGIGQEVTGQALLVLTHAAAGDGCTIEPTEYDLGARRWNATGEALPDTVLTELRQHDAILLGAIGDPSVPSGVLERGLLLRIRFELDHYVNLRPAKIYPGHPGPLADPGPVDFVVVRDAFARAAARERRHLTLVHKHNVLSNAGHLWRRTFEAVAGEFPDVATDYQHVDASTIFLVTDPARFDVIVTDNLFGDIITDLAAAITGGIGLAASGNINPDRTSPSMFEPVHGSAPDIAGQGKADPTAAILSAAMLARHVGLDEAAGRIERAVEGDLAARLGQPPRSTAEIGAAIAGQIG
jgi:3-isopropylmalate dehydrogenase